jgi:hypothetical protein
VPGVVLAALAEQAEGTEGARAGGRAAARQDRALRQGEAGEGGAGGGGMTERTAELEEAVLAGLSEGQGLLAISRRLGIARRTIRSWEERDPAFAVKGQDRPFARLRGLGR